MANIAKALNAPLHAVSFAVVVFLSVNLLGFLVSSGTSLDPAYPERPIFSPTAPNLPDNRFKKYPDHEVGPKYPKVEDRFFPALLDRLSDRAEDVAVGTKRLAYYILQLLIHGVELVRYYIEKLSAFAQFMIKYVSTAIKWIFTRDTLVTYNLLISFLLVLSFTQRNLRRQIFWKQTWESLKDNWMTWNALSVAGLGVVGFIQEHLKPWWEQVTKVGGAPLTYAVVLTILLFVVISLLYSVGRPEGGKESYNPLKLFVPTFFLCWLGNLAVHSISLSIIILILHVYSASATQDNQPHTLQEKRFEQLAPSRENDPRLQSILRPTLRLSRFDCVFRPKPASDLLLFTNETETR